MPLSSDKIIRLYTHDRLSCAQIAHKTEYSETKIYHIIKNLGVRMRGRSEANQIFPDFLFVILYNLGLSASQVARMLGVHTSTVIKRLSSINFPLRSRNVACEIRYSEEEFQRYFMVSSVLERLKQLARMIY